MFYTCTWLFALVMISTHSYMPFFVFMIILFMQHWYMLWLVGPISMVLLFNRRADFVCHHIPCTLACIHAHVSLFTYFLHYNKYYMPCNPWLMHARMCLIQHLGACRQHLLLTLARKVNGYLNPWDWFEQSSWNLLMLAGCGAEGRYIQKIFYFRILCTWPFEARLYQLML